MGKVSLIDLGPNTRLVEWYVVYHPRVPYFWFANLWKQGFRHVDLIRPYQYGPQIKNVLWLVLRPNFDIIDNHIDYDPTPPWLKYPGCTVQKVQVVSRTFKVREWLYIGPATCVEVAKHALGINSFWLRTPWQLYKYIKRRGGVINHNGVR